MNMEAVAMLLDFGIPAMAALGSGLVAYALTGGEDEEVKLENAQDKVCGGNGESIFGNSDDINLTHESRDEVEHHDNDDIAQSFMRQSAELRIESSLSKIDNDLHSLQEIATATSGKMDSLSQVQPIWATQMLEKLNEISSSIKELESKLKGSTSISSNRDSNDNLEDNSLESSTRSSLLEEYKGAIDQAMFGFYHRIADDVSDFPERSRWTTDSAYARRFDLGSALGPACDMLQMFVKNIQRNPELPRFRKIPTNNANYRTLLASAMGHKRVLQAIGFVLKASAWEWSWLSDPEQSSSSTAVAANTSKQEKTLTKEEALSLLTYALQQLQLIRSNKFDLVYCEDSPAVAEDSQTSSLSSKKDLDENSLTAPNSVMLNDSLNNNTLSTISDTKAVIEVISEEAKREKIAEAKQDCPPSSPSKVSNQDDDLVVSSSSVASSPSSSTTPSLASRASSYTSLSHLSHPQNPLSPEAQAVLNKAKALSSFSTSRGALGISPFATSAAAANLFAHDEIVRLSSSAAGSVHDGLSSPASSIASADVSHPVHHYSSAVPLLSLPLLAETSSPSFHSIAENNDPVKTLFANKPDQN